MESILTIDFGTTNSVVYAWMDKKKQIVWNNQTSGEYLFPSFVDYKGDSVVTGFPAKLNIGNPGHFVVSCVKRLIGLTYDDYCKLEKKDLFGCDVVRGDDGYPYFVVSEDGTKRVSCIDVACELFKWIKQNAEDICERTFSKVYVTKPANFLDNQVKAIREAARKAGLCIDKMINEPTAAGIAWCKTAIEGKFTKLEKDSTVLVIDFGGGTLDLSVIKYEGDYNFKVKATSGSIHLGGNDIDNVLVDLVLTKLKTDYSFELDQSKKRTRQKIAKLRKCCEEAKIVVNGQTKDADNYEKFLKLNQKLVYEIDVSYLNAGVDSLIFPFVDVTKAFMKCLESSLEPLRKITSKPDQMISVYRKILLVGGSSQLMAFRQLMYSQKINQSQIGKINPMYCVSEGAFEIAASEVASKNKMHVTETIAVSYGLKSGNDQVVLILKKGMTIPRTSAEIIVYNTDDYPEVIQISVYQCKDDPEDSELVDIDKCAEVETWEFQNPERCRRPSKQQQIGIVFKLQVGGTLEVICRDFAYNQLLLDKEARVLT